MKQRILTSIVILLVIVPVLIFSNYIVYPIVLSVLSVMALYEMFHVIGAKQLSVTLPAYLLGGAFPTLAYFWMWDGGYMNYLVVLTVSLLLYLVYLFLVAVLAHEKVKLADITSVFTTSTYIIFAFSALSLIRYLPKGECYFWLVFIAAWVCDVFAYFVGFFFGKHKLSPVISPKKTIEGSIGGIAFTVIAFLLYGFILEAFSFAEVNYLLMAVSALLLSVVSQVGDLAASLIKREHGVKDYGNLMPGHGGIMDRFDSIVAVSVVLLVVYVLFPPIA